MTNVACESKLRSLVVSSMHPFPGNWVAIGCAVTYNAWATHAFGAGIKCRHCRNQDDRCLLPVPLCFEGVGSFVLGGEVIRGG